MLKYLKNAFFFTLFCLSCILCGCQSEITVHPVSPSERLAYGLSLSGDGISQETSNLLANFLLYDLYEDDPQEAIRRLETIFAAEPLPEYLAALSDISLNAGIRFSKKPDDAIKYFLSAALYSYAYLYALDNPGATPYNENRIFVIRTYNLAIGEVFAYLKQRKLNRRSEYSLSTVGGQRLFFTQPQYKLPVAPSLIETFDLCANYKPENLTHISRRFGIGTPIICQLKPNSLSSDSIRFADNLALPGTLVMRFQRHNRWQDFFVTLQYIDSRNYDSIILEDKEVPLQLDFSTPLAYMVRNPLPFDYLTYMLRPDLTENMQGLYLTEPYSEDRIPVIFVHGLMSNIRTWAQMINTLQNDPNLRKHYQFWGFTYSSGNPVLFSAKLLRDSLLELREKLQKEGKSTEKFDRMVLVGHSMGGLVGKTAIMDADEQLIEVVLGDHYQQKMSVLTTEQKKFVEEMFHFRSLPFVKRIVFIAVPHRGSSMAQRPIGRLGAALIQTPASLLKRGEGIIGNLMQHGELMPNSSRKETGIDDLDPDNTTMKTLAKIPFKEGIPVHSIIGNKSKDGIPGGTDGIVPYASSHLDGVTSELIVKSGHSVQQNPLAIQEMRRILLEHLRSYKDIKITEPQLPKDQMRSSN